MSHQHLDPTLRRVVKLAVAQLGTVIRHNAGLDTYNKIEEMRKLMTFTREMPDDKKQKILALAAKQISEMTRKELFTFAHSFTLMLEVMNACENAYRSFKNSQTHIPLDTNNLGQAIIFVVTAHPTESRSPQNVELFDRLHNILVKCFIEGYDRYQNHIQNILELAWRTPTTRQRKPRVEDEAEYIYSIVLKESRIDELIFASRTWTPIYLRSWVGGDKDGHPGVNHQTMINSLQLSRKYVLKYVQSRLKEVEADLKPLKKTSLLKSSQQLRTHLQKLARLQAGDGKKVVHARTLIYRLFNQYRIEFGTSHPSLTSVWEVSRLFPAFSIPLELREASDVLMETNVVRLNIGKMLSTLARISQGGDPKWYARGLIISMASEWDHIQAAQTLIRKTLGAVKIPIIPLFEQEEALRQGKTLVERILKNSQLKKDLHKYWSGRFEVMLGYSDSAKETGVLNSRLVLSEAIRDIDDVCKKYDVSPVFFHGSGGSVDRGGGSIKEQTAWWTPSCFDFYKTTIQGEMVERTFSSPQILRSHIQRIVAQSEKRDTIQPQQANDVTRNFAKAVSQEYRKTIESVDFLKMVEQATPYRFLKFLRFGSRPSKRGQTLAVSALRAIPWVLCWTQTRTLFPTWWGLGTAWANLSDGERRQLKTAFETDPLFSSFVKTLGFTLAKVELGVWREYLNLVDNDLKQKTFERFTQEFENAKRCVQFLSGQDNLLWFRPWLGESITLRSPMIHPLNLIQIRALRQSDPILIRETVAGIANGMLTTG